MNKTIKRMFVFSLAIILFISITNMAAYAGSNNCKKVNIIIINKRVRLIKVTKVTYLDYSINRWRNESIIGSVKVKPGKQRVLHRTLEHVGGKLTRIRIYYRVKTGFLRWSGVILLESQGFICTNYYFATFIVK